LFVTVTPHWVPQALVLSGVQHVLSGLQYWPFWQDAEPAAPQFTVSPQLFNAWPHCWFPQATESLSGTQPPQTLLLHPAPPSQLKQSMGTPQLSTVFPHRFEHQPGCAWHSHMFFALHTSPGAQPEGHFRIWLQLSGPVSQCVSHQAGSGVQLDASASASASADIASASTGAS
jgi:hypothetical protein